MGFYKVLDISVLSVLAYRVVNIFCAALANGDKEMRKCKYVQVTKHNLSSCKFRWDLMKKCGKICWPKRKTLLHFTLS